MLANIWSAPTRQEGLSHFNKHGFAGFGTPCDRKDVESRTTCDLLQYFIDHEWAVSVTFAWLDLI